MDQRNGESKVTRTSSVRATARSKNGISNNKRNNSLIVIKGSRSERSSGSNNPLKDCEQHDKGPQKLLRQSTSSSLDDFESLVFQSTLADVERMNKNRVCKALLIVCCILLLTGVGQLVSYHTYSTIYADGTNNDGSQDVMLLNGAMKMTESQPYRTHTDSHSIPSKKQQNVATSTNCTVGAILHLGRTGGTLVAQQLLNSSADPRNSMIHYKDTSLGTSLSQLTTYYHHSEFNTLAITDNDTSIVENAITPKLRPRPSPKAHHREPSNFQSNSSSSIPKYKFIILTLRDPFDRTVSSYAWMHPSNPNYTTPVSPSTATERHESFYNVCFPDLNTFASALSDDDDEGGQTDRQQVPQHCKELARSAMNNEVQELEYFFWDTKHVWNHFLVNNNNTSSVQSKLIDDDADVYVIRLESMNEDWNAIHKLLGLSSSTDEHSNPSTSTSKSDSTMTVVRDDSVIDAELTKIHSSENLRSFCRALLPEYEAYLSLIKRATNLAQSEEEQSLSMAQTKCPDLNLQYPS